MVEISGIKTEKTLPRIAVIGSGLMGHGIAQVFAQHGYHVSLHDVDEQALRNAAVRITANLEMLSANGLAEARSIKSAISNIVLTTNLAEAVAGADFVIESAPENLQVKIELFRKMEATAPRDAILATNTSMLKLSDIAQSLNTRDRLVVTHWFNPPYLIPVVEVVKGLYTSHETIDRTVKFLESVGKVPIKLVKEVSGHLLNRIQFAMFRETISLLEQGVATAEEIDKGVSGSLGLRFATIGPLRSMDLAGLDLFWYGMSDLYASLDNSTKPQKIIRDKVNEGAFGRKTGRGFYDYATGDVVSSQERERDEKTMALLKILYGAREGENV